MNDDMTAATYDLKRAKALLSRLGHAVAPDNQRMDVAAVALLTAFTSLGDGSSPFSIAREGPTNARVSLPPRPSRRSGISQRPTALVGYGDGQFVVRTPGGSDEAHVHVAYDAAVGAFVPTGVGAQVVGRDATAVEMMLLAVWDALSVEAETGSTWRNLYR